MASPLTLPLILLLASNTLAASLTGSPKAITVINEKMKSWSGTAQNIPDGKMWMLPLTPNSNTNTTTGDKFLINATPNNLVLSTSSSIEDIDTKPYNGKGSDFTVLPNTLPIPPPATTGLRENGTLYDAGSYWIMNAFRLSTTSLSTNQTTKTSPNYLIGFEHNEDYWGSSTCTSKSIGVRYSHDLGKSWTRSVPIITRGIQTPACNESDKFTGTGDFAAMWNPQRAEWVIFACEGPLVMSTSRDPLGRPGTWTRHDPVSGKSAPGFIGAKDGTVLGHGDLISVEGANPSIMRDEKGGEWHMVYDTWNGSLLYTKSRDLYRWSKPSVIFDGSEEAPSPGYPTLVGDGGDALTTTGRAEMYFGAGNQVDWGRALWSVGVEF